MKVCCYCNTEKPRSAFYVDKSKPDGLKPRCKTCEKLYKDFGLRRKYEKKYRERHPEKRKLIMSNYYQNNKGKHKEAQSRYRQTEEFKIINRNIAATRRARIRKTPSEKIDYSLIYNNSPFCFYCDKPLSINEVEFDHYIPLSRGGSHTADNIRVSCMTCNRRKGAMTYQMV